MSQAHFFGKELANHINAILCTPGALAARQDNWVQSFDVPCCPSGKPEIARVSFAQTGETVYKGSAECSEPHLIQEPVVKKTLRSHLAGSIVSIRHNAKGLSIQYDNTPCSPYKEWAEAMKELLGKVTDDRRRVTSDSLLTQRDDQVVSSVVRLEQQMGETGIFGEICPFPAGVSAWWNVQAAVAALKFYLADRYHVTTVASSTDQWIQVVLLPL